MTKQTDKVEKIMEAGKNFKHSTKEEQDTNDAITGYTESNNSELPNQESEDAGDGENANKIYGISYVSEEERQ